MDEEWITVSGGPTGSVRARIVKPAGAEGTLPVILYIHGAGWVFGNAHTHDRLVRELAVGAGAAVVFPEYDLSPEARYPVAIEQNYAVAKWVVEQGETKDLDGSRLAVAGDSVAGNMSAADADGQAARRCPLVQQVLFYPVTDASFDTGSYHQFAADAFPSVFAADVPADVTKVLAVAQRPLAAAAAWKTKPSWALVAGADEAINPEVERFGAERAGATVVEIEGASHAVAVAQPKEVADLIRDAVRATS
ncbi:alpha/beta fold hydrolase [Streptomyces turgidiscabies]|uniref:alpha/beta fold hydrolase n=1 Tax=Streptomyces turgidiscabies TaxID=85558 RepID=UPI0027D90F47|nr:alpha/beta hydrolase [Streptomyces turgidiscabies]